MSRRHTYLQRSTLPPSAASTLCFDVFVSAFDLSERVTSVFNQVTSAEKYWLVHAEYDFAPADLGGLHAPIILDRGLSEIDSWLLVWDRVLAGRDPSTLKICVDISGLMRPFIAVLPLMLARLAFKKVTIVYSDPRTYASGIATQFAKGAVEEVRQVPGLEGVHTTSTETADALIIGAGYDDELIRQVANYKKSAQHFIMLGLPSLQPHMYQESQLKVARAAEAIRAFASRSFVHAPANDPFVTAEVLGDLISKLRSRRSDVNVYLSPVGPKAHVLGFGWFMACEELDKATSMIFPYSPSYSTGSATGISRVHVYEFDTSWIVTPSAESTV